MKKLVYSVLLLSVIVSLYFIFRKKCILKEDNLLMLEKLNKDTRKKAEKFLCKAEKEGFNLRITSSTRTPEEQNILYQQGRTTAGNIVTNAQAWQSWHNYKSAFDVVERKKGYSIDWDKLIKIAESFELESGKSFSDLPHFQNKQGYTISQLIALKNSDNLPDKMNYLKV